MVRLNFIRMLSYLYLYCTLGQRFEVLLHLCPIMVPLVSQLLCNSRIQVLQWEMVTILKSVLHHLCDLVLAGCSNFDHFSDAL